jgi:hypothetical protein
MRRVKAQPTSQHRRQADILFRRLLLPPGSEQDHACLPREERGFWETHTKPVFYDS